MKFESTMVDDRGCNKYRIADFHKEHISNIVDFSKPRVPHLIVTGRSAQSVYIPVDELDEIVAFAKQVKTPPGDAQAG